MSIPSEVDILTEGVEKLLFQFEEQPKIVPFLESYLKQINKTQQDTLYLLSNRGVFNATGVFLDNIGALLGESRQWRGDEDYRDRILDRILINNSEGTPKDVLTVLKEVTEATDVRLFAHYPADIHLFTNGVDRDLNNVVPIMNDVVPAGTSDVTIIGDQPEGVFTPYEIPYGSLSGNLTTLFGDEIITGTGDNITVAAEYQPDTGVDTYSATFAELFGITTTEIKVSYDGFFEEPLSIYDGVDTENLCVNAISQPDGAPNFAEIYNKNYNII